jgi:hypothetical protein
LALLRSIWGGCGLIAPLSRLIIRRQQLEATGYPKAFKPAETGLESPIQQVRHIYANFI